MEKQKTGMKQMGLILDFDGVLAIPHTNPVELYPQVPTLLEQLAAKYTLALASFNPTAIAELRRFQLLHHFQGMRAGSHHNIEFIEYVRNLGPLCKAEQIQSLHNDQIDHCNFLFFFDDDQGNIARVQSKLPHVQCIYIEEKSGLTESVVNEALTAYLSKEL
jgi:hypothetical protein